MNKGYFVFTDEILKNKWHVISLIFKDFRPTHIEFRHWENDIWYYYGVSALFEKVIEGDLIPQYVVESNLKDNTYKFIKSS